MTGTRSFTAHRYAYVERRRAERWAFLFCLHHLN